MEQDLRVGLVEGQSEVCLELEEGAADVSVLVVHAPVEHRVELKVVIALLRAFHLAINYLEPTQFQGLVADWLGDE